ncbi:MAG TPA: hypothetical protein VIY48_10645 [Candidatus Paceibacterota bacterium]
MFPIDLPALFLDEIRGSRRPNDGLLHASTDLAGSLRHSQLRLADAPVNDRELADEIRLAHGTLWHEWFHDTLEKHGVPFFHEVPLKDFMPEGWSGTADWVFWHPDYKAFVLGDLKTARGEAMYWIERDGAKKEHIWQLSAYFYALLKMGLPMVKGFAVMYWPMNNVGGELILPSVQECDPIPEELVVKEMETRWELSKKYLDEFGKGYSAKNPSDFINEYLAPPMEREQKLYWSKQYKSFEVKLMPHWTSKFCPYDDELCDCSQQGTTKIGQWVFSPDHLTDRGDVWSYEARKGYEEIEPMVQPSKSEQDKRAKEANG